MNYKEILQNIINNGTPKQPVRFDSNGNYIKVENSTIGVFGSVFEHDMSQGFPLTTLRKMPFKSTCIELEGFINGITSKKWYKDRGCNYWNYWCCPQKLKEICKEKYNKDPKDLDYSIIKEIQEEEDFLGRCVYGASWRNFHDPEAFIYCDNSYLDGKRIGQSIDQLRMIVEKLHSNPYDRRMIVNSWNPLGFNNTALPACHTGFMVCVYGDKLNLAFDQRSCDWLLNQTVVTYGLMILLLCEETGLKPGILQGRFVDNHVYENQLEAAKELLKREERELPTVTIKRKSDGSFSIFDWKYSDIILDNYNPHGKIDIGKVTV